MQWRMMMACGMAAVALSSASAAPPTTNDGALGLGPAARITWNTAHTAARRIDGLAVPTAGADPGERARAFVRDHRALLAVEDVRIVDVKRVRLPDPHVPSYEVVRAVPTWRGLPIEGWSLVVRIDAAGRVTAVANDGEPLTVAPIAHEIDGARALEVARSTFRIVAANSPEKVVLPLGSAARVAWKIAVAALPIGGAFWVWVDAEDGRVLRESPAASDQTLRTLPRREVTP